MVPSGGLPATEVEALIKRYLSSEAGVVAQPLKGATAFLCVPPFGDAVAARRVFAVASGGGVLLRLDAATRERVVESGLGRPNAALPESLTRLEPEVEGGDDPADMIGGPDEWVWVPIGEGAAFERRRPHIAEALAYSRHCLETRTDGLHDR